MMLRKRERGTPDCTYESTVREVPYHTILYYIKLIISILQPVRHLRKFLFLHKKIPSCSSFVPTTSGCRPCRAGNRKHRKPPQDVPTLPYSAEGSIQVWHRKKGRMRWKGTFTIRVYLPQMYTISVKQTKKTGIFAPIFKGSLCSSRKKTYICPF